MKAIIESHIPGVPEALSRLVDIVRLDPEDITPAAVKDADALIVRTRTRCDASLLDGSKVRFVATATIGTDHIDIPYCRSRGIEVASAPGCNAPAVAQYVCSSICHLVNPAGLTLGVVGVGHVGTIVTEWGRRLGMTVMPCDPPRADIEGPDGFFSLDEIASQADVITFHVPHTLGGAYPTHHMADHAFFSSLRRRPMIINSARGPIVNTEALIAARENGMVGDIVIDCWENEPAIDHRLLALANIATPHIAGYSAEGKQRATMAVVDALCRFAGIDFTEAYTTAPDPFLALDSWRRVEVDPVKVVESYDPSVDTARLRHHPASFEALRNHYHLRAEIR